MNVFESILVRKVLIEIGAMQLDEASKYFDSLQEHKAARSLCMSLFPFPRNIKTLTGIIGECLESNNFTITSDRLEQAAKTAGDILFSQYKTGTISLKDICFFLGKLPAYGCYIYIPASDAYDLYVEGICSSLDDVRRTLDDAFKNESLDIPLSSITTIKDSVIYYRDDRGDELPLLNLNDCHDNYKKYIALHPDEYSPFKENHHCVADRCWNDSYAFFLFYMPKKIYISIRTKPSVWHIFFNRIGWNWAAKQMNQFFAFQKKINAAGYSTYDLT